MSLTPPKFTNSPAGGVVVNGGPQGMLGEHQQERSESLGISFPMARAAAPSSHQLLVYLCQTKLNVALPTLNLR